MAIIRLGHFDPDPTIESSVPKFVEAVYKNLKKTEPEGKLRDDNFSALRTVIPFENFRSFDEFAGVNIQSIAQIQDALRDAGFLSGELEKGFYGYRTRSAMRLFQEYIRTYEDIPLAECWPDGIYGSKSHKQLLRWKSAKKKANWLVTDSGETGLVARWEEARSQNSTAPLEGTEFLNWLNYLNEIKDHYQSTPNTMIKKVNDFNGATDTIKVANWDFGIDHIHLIGIRRDPERGKGRGSDDVFLLLIKGMVFKFQGSTDPGKSENEDGAPFIVQGQHNYQFGWHQQAYMALRPQDPGVLVVRSKDFKLRESNVLNGFDSTPNKTINIHWGGRGGQDKVIEDKFPWSAGCQVITGTGYLDHRNLPVDCSEYRAALPDEPFTSKTTRGAYNVLSDLVTALSGGMADSSNANDKRDMTVKYMLLNEEDLARSAFASGTLQNAIGFRSKMK